MPPCGGSCGSLANARERIDQEPRDKDAIQFDIMMLVMEMNNSIKKEDKSKVYENLKSLIDIYFN
jgi:hypothetical protein